MENDELGVTTLGEDDVILPDGWQEGDDIFAETPLEPEEETADGSDPEAETKDENEGETSGTEAPTTGDPNETADPAAEAKETETADGPEAGSTKAPRILKLKVNHATEDVDVNALNDEELTALLQKGRAFDAMRESENKNLFRQVYQEQLDAGMTEAIAKIVARDAAGGKNYALADEEPTSDESDVATEVRAKEPPTRDFYAEIEQLKALYPDFKEVPDDVAKAAAKGVPLLTAYLAYRDKQSAKTATALKKENDVLKQNAASAARAPVRGVSGGGVQPKAETAFLKGFNSDPW